MKHHVNESKILLKIFSKNRDDFLKQIGKIGNAYIKSQARKFYKKTASSYHSFVYESRENGLNVFMATKPGIVKGSYANYVKICYKDGSLRAVFKETVDNKGNKVHMHVKYPEEEI